MPYTAPFDLLIDSSLRIEVKTSQMQIVKGVPGWRFNIHRHGSVNETKVDKYILRLEGVPYTKAAIHLLVDAPIVTPTIKISLRSLLDRYSPLVTAFNEFCAGRKIYFGSKHKRYSKKR